MTDLAKLNVSLTKHGAHKIAALLKKYDSDEILNHLWGSEPGINIDPVQAKKNLSVSGQGKGEVVPKVWALAQKQGSQAIDALVLVAIILSHHQLIDAVKRSASKFRFAGTIRRDQVLGGKAFTNFAHTIEELGYSIEHSSDHVRYDFDKLFQIPQLNSLVKEVLRLKLIKAGWNGKNSIVEESTALGLHEVFSLSRKQFGAWLATGSLTAEQRGVAGFLDHEFFSEADDDRPAGKFEFRPGHKAKKTGVIAIGGPRELQTATLLHNKIQNQMYISLAKKYGKSCVGTEVPTGDGTAIDIVVKTKQFCWFYEIKTDASVRGCVRQAIPQLLEYAYWQGDNTRADKLIIVSVLESTRQAEAYLAFLRKRFKLNIFYEQFLLAESNRSR